MDTATTKARHFTEAEITGALMACIAWAGNVSAAVRSLKAQGKRAPSTTTLTEWMRVTHAAKFNDLREKYQETIEQQLTHDMREMAAQAMEVQRLGLEKARKRLEGDKDDDPARTASHAARVAQSNVDKMLSLSGRPTSIREDRNVNEILRSLAARGVLQLPEATVEEEPDGGDG